MVCEEAKGWAAEERKQVALTSPIGARSCRLVRTVQRATRRPSVHSIVLSLPLEDFGGLMEAARPLPTPSGYDQEGDEVFEMGSGPETGTIHAPRRPGAILVRAKG
jgi:hypothetical protein